MAIVQAVSSSITPDKSQGCTPLCRPEGLGNVPRTTSGAAWQTRRASRIQRRCLCNLRNSLYRNWPGSGMGCLRSLPGNGFSRTAHQVTRPSCSLPSLPINFCPASENRPRWKPPSDVVIWKKASMPHLKRLRTGSCHSLRNNRRTGGNDSMLQGLRMISGRGGASGPPSSTLLTSSVLPVLRWKRATALL